MDDKVCMFSLCISPILLPPAAVKTASLSSSFLVMMGEEEEVLVTMAAGNLMIGPNHIRERYR